jgi:hypothetical protein
MLEFMDIAAEIVKDPKFKQFDMLEARERILYEAKDE